MDRPRKIDQSAYEGSLAPALSALIPWVNRQLSCSHCGRCTRRCEVLREPGLDIGRVERAYQNLMALPADERIGEVRAMANENTPLYRALRRCCFCGYCTAACAHHVLGADRMRDFRELLCEAGILSPDDTRLTLVDNEWDIFSAYRAIYGISYDDFLSLDQAAQSPGSADYLLFPGCSLTSYTPGLTRAVAGWLTENGFRWAFSDACCGSPLMSAGLFERAEALRASIIERCRAAQIHTILTVCPGCGEELNENLVEGISIKPLPELMWEVEQAHASVGEPLGLTPLPMKPHTAAVFDSCHDRTEGRHGAAIRALIRNFVPDVELTEIPTHASMTLCCGAGGAVSVYDADITRRRTDTVLAEARRSGAADLITMCPTCAYTFAEALLGAHGDDPLTTHHYLELLFGIEIDWKEIFAALEAMWTGEYGPWLTATFFA